MTSPPASSPTALAAGRAPRACPRTAHKALAAPTDRERRGELGGWRHEAPARTDTHHEVPGEVVLPIVIRTLHGLDPLDEPPQDLHLLHPPASPPPPARAPQRPLRLPQLAPARPPSPPRQAAAAAAAPAGLPAQLKEQRRFPLLRGEPRASAGPNPQPAPSSFPALLSPRRRRLRNTALSSPCPLPGSASPPPPTSSRSRLSPRARPRRHPDARARTAAPPQSEDPAAPARPPGPAPARSEWLEAASGAWPSPRALAARCGEAGFWWTSYVWKPGQAQWVRQ